MVRVRRTGDADRAAVRQIEELEGVLVHAHYEGLRRIRAPPVGDRCRNCLNEKIVARSVMSEGRRDVGIVMPEVGEGPGAVVRPPVQLA
jgi:hypothetical protein